MIEQSTRRGVLRGLLWVAAAPAIVRASSLMPVKALAPLPEDYIIYGNRLLTIDAITREAMRIFAQHVAEDLFMAGSEYPVIGSQLIIRSPIA